jgi:hypothetical protein
MHTMLSSAALPPLTSDVAVASCSYIYSHYSRIKEVERELCAVQLQLKLTAGPKKHALEMLRKKIETQGEKVAAARQRFTAAKQVFAYADRSVLMSA